MAARRSPPQERERQRPRASAAGNDQVHSWTLVTSQALDTTWRVAKGSVTLAVSFLVGTLCYFRRLHLYLGHRLKRWIGYLQRRFKRNLSVEAEVDLLSHCAREWKGETPHAKLMRKVCLFIQLVVAGEFVCKNRETRIPFCFTKCGTKNNCGSN